MTPLSHTSVAHRLVLAGLIGLVAALLPLSGASAAHLTGVTQLVGDDNIDAALAWSDPGAFPDGGLESGARDPQFVLIGRDDIFPDNLASGALQGANGPLLLTQSDSLSDDVVDEIRRLDVDQAIILGETEAISAEVEAQLNDLVSDVSRLGGTTRIETAIEVTRANASEDIDVDAGGGIGEGTLSSTAILARAFDSAGGSDSAAFADSLAAGGWAAEAGFGVLLTQTDVLTDSVRDYLEEDEIDRIIIVGGTSAVSEQVEEEVREMGITVERVGGTNRAATAVAIAEERNEMSMESTGGTILVEGFTDDAWASGFPAAATSALEGYPIVLSNGLSLPPETEDYADDVRGMTTQPDTGTDGGVITDPDTGTDDDMAADVVCGPLMQGAGEDGPNDDNASDDRAQTCEEFAERSGADTGRGFGTDSDGGDGDSADGSGAITEIDTDADRFTYESADADTEEPTTTTVNYSEQDTFTLDGEPSTLEEFEEEAAEGDEVTVTTQGGDRTIDLMPAGGLVLPELPV